VIPTAKGLEVFEIVHELVPEIERDVETLLGVDRTAALREDLQRLRGSPGAAHDDTARRHRTTWTKSRPSLG
jgi:hypothetical protein